MIEGDPQSVVDELAARLERSVVVNDAGVRLLWASRHFGDEDPVRIRAVLQRDAGPEVAAHVLSSGVADWRTDGVVPGHPGLGLTARRCVPIRVGDELVAMLLVIDADATLSGEQLALMHAAAREVGRLLDAGAQRRRRAALEEEVSAFLGVEAAVRAGARRRLEAAGTWSGAPRTRVAVVGPSGAPGGTTISGAAPALTELRAVSAPAPGVGPHPFVVGSGGLTLLVWCGPAAPTDTAVEGAVRSWVARVPALAAVADGWVAGTGPLVDDPADAWRSARLAVLACRAATLPGSDQVVASSTLGVLGVLLRIDPAELDDTAVPEGLRRLREADARTGGSLVATLRAFLDLGCSAPRTADALFIHRTSLYYRLDRIAEVLGADLADGRTRLELHLGLHLLDLGGAFRQSEEGQR